MTCDEIRESLEDYVLGTLPGDERSRVEEHLEGCPTCRKLAEEYETALQGLSEALAVVSPVRLPPELKGRMLARIEAEGALAAPTHSPQRPWLGLGRIGVLVGAVLLLFSIASTVAFAVTLDRHRSVRDKLAEFVDDQELVIDLLDGRGRQKYILRSPDPDSDAYGKLFTHPHLRAVLVMGNRLPAPKIGQGYHVWVTRKGETRLAGILRLNKKGFGAFLFTADRPGPAYEDVRVMLQPKGSTAPKGQSALAYAPT